MVRTGAKRRNILDMKLLDRDTGLSYVMRKNLGLDRQVPQPDNAGLRLSVNNGAIDILISSK